MRELQTFQAGSNAFVGELPPQLSRMTALRSLNLNSNPGLSGAVPDLSLLTQLDDLRLFNTGLTGSVRLSPLMRATWCVCAVCFLALTVRASLLGSRLCVDCTMPLACSGCSSSTACDTPTTTTTTSSTEERTQQRASQPPSSRTLTSMAPPTRAATATKGVVATEISEAPAPLDGALVGGVAGGVVGGALLLAALLLVCFLARRGGPAQATSSEAPANIYGAVSLPPADSSMQNGGAVDSAAIYEHGVLDVLDVEQ